MQEVFMAMGEYEYGALILALIGLVIMLYATSIKN